MHPSAREASVRTPPPAAFWLAAALGAALTAIAAAVVLSEPDLGDRGLIALGRALVIAVPVAVGLWAWRRRPADRFGRLLVAAGCLWFLTTLAESGNEVVYSAGRVGVWLVEPALVLVMLAFPAGRLAGRTEHALVLAAAATVAVLFLPTAVLVESFPTPAPYTSCGGDCPDNAFMVVAEEPAFVEALVRPLRDAIAVAIFAAVLVVLARRASRSTRIMRRTLSPVIAVAILRAAAFVVYVPVRRVEPSSGFLDVVGWIYVLTLPGLAVAFVLGITRARLEAGEALQRLALRLRSHPEGRELDAVLGEAMEDPSLELAYWVSERWVDADGAPLELPPRDPGRAVIEVVDDGRRVAALVHDSALRDQEEYVQAAAALAASALEHQRLAAEVAASLQEVRESRARIQAAADGERRRIERDLHDGAQQRLVALRIRLGLAAELVREDPARGDDLLGELGLEAEEALEEVRAIAHGVYPSLLADRGLAEALRALARRGSPPLTVEVGQLGRYPEDVESAVYFCCLEAVQNTAKHAPGATSVSLAVVEDGALRFDVRDDGPGFDEDARAGAGFTNMRDRVAAVGGELSIRSVPGEGTSISGSIPLSTADGNAPRRSS